MEVAIAYSLETGVDSRCNSCSQLGPSFRPQLGQWCGLLDVYRFASVADMMRQKLRLLL